MLWAGAWAQQDPNHSREGGAHLSVLSWRVCLNWVSPKRPVWGLPVSFRGLCTECGVGVATGEEKKSFLGRPMSPYLSKLPTDSFLPCHPKSPDSSGVLRSLGRSTLGSQGADHSAGCPPPIPQLPYPERPVGFEGGPRRARRRQIWVQCLQEASCIVLFVTLVFVAHGATTAIHL